MAASERNEVRAKALQTSYAETTAWLIGEHREEFDAHRAKLLSDAGYEWSPPLTAEERAAKAKAEQEERDAKALEKILARSPGLMEKVTVKPVTDPHS